MTRVALLFLALAVAPGCSDGRPATDGGSPRDASRGIDAVAPPDAHAPDAWDALDAAEADSVDGGDGPDAPVEQDAATPEDAPPDTGPADAFVARDAPAACGSFALSCADSPDCGTYGCDPRHRICVPIGRAACGGSGGVACSGSVYTECRRLAGEDYGPCLTPAEDACACARAGSVFACP